MSDNLTNEQRANRVRALLLKLEECEQECHALALHDTAHLVNGAKNGVGWGFARLMEKKSGGAVSTSGGRDNG